MLPSFQSCPLQRSKLCAAACTKFLLVYVSMVAAEQTWTLTSWWLRPEHAGSGRMRSMQCWRTMPDSRSMHSPSTSPQVCVLHSPWNPDLAAPCTCDCLVSVTEFMANVNKREQNWSLCACVNYLVQWLCFWGWIIWFVCGINSLYPSVQGHLFYCLER